MKYCRNCGKELNSDIQYCPNCGASVSEEQSGKNENSYHLCLLFLRSHIISHLNVISLTALVYYKINL